MRKARTNFVLVVAAAAFLGALCPKPLMLAFCISIVTLSTGIAVRASRSSAVALAAVTLLGS